MSSAAARLDNASRAAHARSAIDARLILVWLVVGVTLLLMAMPIVLLVISSVREGTLVQAGAFTLQNFRNILQHPAFAQTVVNTLMLGAGSVIVMLAFALPFAWLYTRTNLPAKGPFLALLTCNVAMPGFTVAMGYVLLLNPNNGVLNVALKQALGLESALFNVYGLEWMIVLQGLALVPPAFFMIVPTLRAIDSSLEEAAAASGVPSWVTTLRIVLPLAAPAILATAIYYFIIAIETFDYASMLGFPVRTYVVSTWLYQLMYPGSDVPRYGDAAALGILTTIVALCLGAAFVWATRRASRYIVLTGKRRQQKTLELSRTAKTVAWAVIIAYVFFALLLPLLMLVWASVVPYLQPPSLRALDTATWYAYLEAWAEFKKLAINNVAAMLAVPTMAVAFAACVSWIAVRSKSRWRPGLELFLVCAIAVPSIVGALAFLYFGLATYRFLPIYGTIWLIVLAMAIRYVTWANRSISSAMMQLHPELEEACTASGIRRGAAFTSVTLPLVRPALLFSWFWIALLTLRELTIPVMLTRPDTQTLSTAIWSFNVAGNLDIASALSVMLVLFIAALLLIFSRFTRSLTV